MEIIYLILGLVIGALLIYLIIKPKLKQFETLDESIAKKNEELRAEGHKISEYISTLYDKKNDLTIELEALKANKEKENTAFLLLQAEKENTKNTIEDLKNQANESAKIFEEQTITVAQNNIEQSVEKLRLDFLAAEEAYRQEYQNIIAECVEDLKRQLAEKELAIEETTNILNDLIAKTNSAVEANKRAEEIKNQNDFYKLQLSEEDIEEIEKLRSVIPYLRNSEPLNKVIWKVYYENPYTALVGRVIGNGTHTGIYKITNIENQMCYVGQAANLADRWKQHIKRGIGAETPTKNKLYPAMLKYGVENFTFEVIEECDRSMLNDREDYWQDYFHAKDFGYSIK